MIERLEPHLQRQIEHARAFFWHRIRWRAVASYLPPEAPFDLVDVGAGAGLLAEYLAGEFPLATYRFVEPIESLAQKLESRHGSGARLSPTVDYGDARFVALLDVLEHQEEDTPFLQDIIGKMRPGATLLLTVPALETLWSGWDEMLGHYRRYNRARLRDLFAQVPADVHEISYLFPEMIPAAIVRRARIGRYGGVTNPHAAEFPDLPGLVNAAFYALGRATLAARRSIPLGTSVFAAATRRDHAEEGE